MLPWMDNILVALVSNGKNLFALMETKQIINRIVTLSMSTKSDKPKSLVGKMKKLVKSKSIEEKSHTAVQLVQAGVQVSAAFHNFTIVTMRPMGVVMWSLLCD